LRTGNPKTRGQPALVKMGGSYPPSCNVLFILCALCLILPSALAWGADGHQIIALVAQSLLNPTARSNAMIWSAGQPLAKLSLEPDLWKGVRCSSWANPMHYVNMPKGSTSYSFNQSSCSRTPFYCAVSAVTNYTRRLASMTPRGARFNPKECTEPSPLAMILHIAGDLHQPLHVGYSEDLGGNSVQVSFFGRQMNLHSLWDQGILVRHLSGGSWEKFAQQLLSEIQADPGFAKIAGSPTDPNQWAAESFRYVLSGVYNFTKEIPVRFAGSHEKREAGQAPSLGARYDAAMFPIVKYQLKRSGIRIARLLNDVLGRVMH